MEFTSDGVLSDESGSVVVKPCTTREVEFYETSLAHPEFAAWMPAFYGTLTLSNDMAQTSGTSADSKPHDRQSSLVLQNLTYGFEKPCVLDIKLGAQLWDEFAPQEKRDRLDNVANKTTSGSMGMRVAGMKVWKGEAGYKVFDKHYGQALTHENVIESFKEYFASEITAEDVKLLAGRLLRKVKDIEKMLASQESRAYSASLLFVYEGSKKELDQALKDEAARKPKTEDDDDDDDDDEKVKMVEELKLIDFAHSYWTPGKGPDENTLQGVRSVESLLAAIA
jgi:1D-myo-inositol-tetrakisphosphate 5-kinase/inositol-polyphosphate multikinase